MGLARSQHMVISDEGARLDPIGGGPWTEDKGFHQ